MLRNVRLSETDGGLEREETQTHSHIGKFVKINDRIVCCRAYVWFVSVIVILKWAA